MIRLGLKFLIFPISTLLLLTNCSDKAPIEEEKFIQVYVDLLILQDTTATNDTNLTSLKGIVLSKHNVTAEDYKNTIDYYNSSPKKWEEFFNKATAYVEKLKQEAGN
ncbi:MAG: DUF4296 domain-containing protein [Ignavibacteria bacterium]|nr:DUF4296 domain-containing protein [Ignavibacteria bacterium]MBT8381418.1 DUF4296 domain-containing protein [Ignavibacteria bacterium]MBT8390153.1 DUF4296 domain-containing protein [Ignavibacteria bacterium]NNJ53240.1 DUF4296 domain-containing protein [Ignavibacteriaceae bacterium]NNL20332.1 DUF4296 domain-containing protein [Ignavibacteriaceae bacterium]